jgi:HSP20 family protein
MQQNMDQLWHSFSSGGGEGQDVENWATLLDVVQEGDNIVVKADVLTIKGQTKEEWEHQEGNYLMRERRAGSFYRALRLPDTVDSDQAQPHYENGVLSITFPRMELKKAKRLHITGGQGSEGQTIEGQTSQEQATSHS